MNKALTGWNVRYPTLFDDLQREVNRVLDRFGDSDTDAEVRQGFAPRMNLAECENSYEVSCDLPGVKPEEVNIEFKDGQLWITGERKYEKEEQAKKYHRVERVYGQFRRVIALGTDVDAERIDAAYKDGVLTVHVPKAEAVRPKKIAIRS